MTSPNSNQPEQTVIHEETVRDHRVPVNTPPIVAQVVIPTPVAAGVPVVTNTPQVVSSPVITNAAPGVTETRTTDVYDNPVERKIGMLQQIRRLLYFVLAALEILFAFRFVLKALAAQEASGFASFIYGVTEPFVAPFVGVFNQSTPQTGAYFSLPTLLAMAVTALLIWGLVQLIWLIAYPRNDGRTVSTSINRKQRL